MINCEHNDFTVEVDVNRLPAVEGGPIERYSADVRIKCAECGVPFRFLGLPAGLDLTGAATSVDGEEARLAILPRGQVLSVIDGAPQGFTIKRQPGDPPVMDKL